MRYTAVIEKGQESGFVAYIPALKGCVSQGETRKNAMANLKEAAEAYIETLIEDHLPVPPEVEIQEVELEVA
jgi:predicted RNase H-like HicB family nuclease